MVKKFELPEELGVKRRITRVSEINERALNLFSESDRFGIPEWRQAVCIASGMEKRVTSKLAAHKTLTKLMERGLIEKESRGVYRKVSQSLWE